MLLLHYDRYCRDRFLCTMVRNTMILLGQCQLSPLRVHTDRPVATKDIFDTSILTPNMCDLYCNASIISNVLFITVISDPNFDDSTEFCLLPNQIIGALLQNNSMPVWDRLVSVSPALFLSTKQCDNMKLPLTTGIFPGIDSPESL